MQSYLDLYHSGPLTKAEILNRMQEGREVDPEFAKKFRIQRRGKDKDDIFWQIGKIHGLENIAFLTEEQLASVKGDPIKLQKLINEVNDAPKPLPPQSFDELLSDLKKAMEDYKKSLDASTNGKVFKPSDRKKMLALPFQQAKHQELPAPKKGQKEWDFFFELYGAEWD